MNRIARWLVLLLMPLLVGQSFFGCSPPRGSIPREVLSANRTYFARPDGNDNCNGLVNQIGSQGACAFRTVQRMMAHACTYIDLASFTVTLDMTAFSAGGNSENLQACDYVSNMQNGQPTMVLKATGVNQTGSFLAAGIQRFWTINGGTWKAIGADAESWVNVDQVTIPADGVLAPINAATIEVISLTGGNVNNLSFSGNAQCPINASVGGKFIVQTGRQITIVGTPAWTLGWICLDPTSIAYLQGTSFNGAANATGPRFRIDSRSGLITGADPNTILPGSINGTIVLLDIAHGGTNAAIAAAARAQLGVDVGSNANAAPPGNATGTISAANAPWVALTVALTAPRTWTLPLANSVKPGSRLLVSDFGGIVGVNSLTIQSQGNDLLLGNPAQNNAITLSNALDSVLLQSDGGSLWVVVALNSATTTYNKSTDPITAPGAGRCVERWIAGSTAGTCKKIAYCGTSTIGTVIVDNVGGSC
jgi:hypothetical protein